MRFPTVVITQPNYLPWLGYFEQIKRSDRFVFLDNVQYQRREWQNRNRIKQDDNQVLWLTVPVLCKGNYLSPINTIKIDYSMEWSKQHLAAIKHCYSNAQYKNDIIAFLERVFVCKYARLVDLNIALIKEICKLIGISPDFYLASDLNPTGSKTDLLIDVCKKLGARSYYSSDGARSYMEQDEYKFERHEIEVVYQNYEHPSYCQKGNVFTPYLSIVDLIAHVGWVGVSKMFESF